jgi:uncharacterized protein YndB with AHSA1/START domain
MPRTQITADPGVPQIVITREFTAARDLVFRAHVEPELLAQWLGPRELTMTIDRYEARDGGRWRYVHADAGGHEHGFHGVFHGTPSPDGVVQTFEFEGAPGHVSSPWTRSPSSSATAGRWCARSRASSRSRTATRWSPPAWNTGCTTRTSAWPSCSPGWPADREETAWAG